MSLKTLKQLQVVVGLCVAGVLASFAMAIVTAHRTKPVPQVRENPAVIPVPAAPATHVRH